MRELTRSWSIAVLQRVHRRVSVARTAFALPFCIAGAVIACESWPPLSAVLYLVLCVIFGRATVVGCGRVFGAPESVADLKALEDPGSELPPPEPLPRPVWAAFTVHAAAMLVLFAWLLNPLAGWLSLPFVALVTLQAAIRSYSGVGHLLVGIALGAAPLASWVAFRGELSGAWPGVATLAVGVAAWATSFDMVYSLQSSLRVGEGPGHFKAEPILPKATILLTARLGHLVALFSFAFASLSLRLGWASYVAWILCAFALLFSDFELRRCGTDDASPRWVGLNLMVGPLLLLGVILGRAVG